MITGELLDDMFGATPEPELVAFPVLYKYTSKGQPQQWQIFQKGNYYYTEEGIVGGVITKSKPTYCFGKNLGKANETTPQQQALNEAESKHKKKLESHYNEVLTEERSFYEPMLAHSVEDHMKLLFTVPTYIQPKLDGVRAISQNNVLTSRGGKFWVTCPHLHQEGVILDGELYNHKFRDDFDSLISLFRKQKPTDEDLENAERMGEMHVYDFPGHDGVFSERYEKLMQWFHNVNKNPMYKLVPTYLVDDMESLEFFHNQFLEQGYEGSIIRLDLGKYENKRSKQVLKYKVFVDDEFEVVGFEEGKGNKAGMVGKVNLVLPDGRRFNSNMEGSHDFSKKVWENQDEYIGTKATVKFQNYTPKGIPRIPYVKSFNRESYE